MKKNSNLSSVENALKILECFSINKNERRVTQIANELGLAKSTVSRLLKTLHNNGYVKKNLETQKFSLGTKILTLYSSLMSQMEIVKEARPFLEKLAKDTSESVQLAQLEGTKIIYLEQIQSSYPIQIFAHIGRINPIHCTSSGKLLLAYQNEEIIEEILKEPKYIYTKTTITDNNILKKQLKEIKKMGYCLIENEYVDGIVSIAAPIRDYNNNVISAISLVGPIQRFTVDKIPRFINKVVSSANEISLSMGYKLQ